jgi:amino acid transporter
MLFSIGLLIVIGYLAYRASPRERQEDAHVHGAGQIGLLAAVALFGVDYFTSFFYATGEMMSSLHPYGLEKYGYIAVAFIAFANAVFGILYMYSLGIFNEGGGSYTASMRYLTPALSLVVAVVLIQDYVFTIVVSTLSGVDQALSLRGATGIPWYWHFLIAAILVSINYYLTIRGRGESARVVFIMLFIFVMLTIAMAFGLFKASAAGVAALPLQETQTAVPIGTALYHMLTASMKGLVALSGLEAMSNGIQFVKNEDAGIVKWGKKRLPRFKSIWGFYSGKSGIGRIVQTSFLFYGGITTLLLASFAIRFDAYDGTLGRTLVGNLAFIGFGQLQGGVILFWAYQILAVALLTAASMTAFQDLQATAWRDVAIGEIPEVVVYRNPAGTFTRSVTAGYIISLFIMLILRAKQSAAVPYYGIGVFMPIMVMGLAIRKHILAKYTGRVRKWGSLGALFAAIMAALVFVGQIVGKWTEGGWVVLISFSILVLAANSLLISPIGYRDVKQIHRIVREKARVQGSMGSIVEWQSLKMQEYRYSVLVFVTHVFEMIGVRRPVRFEPPIPAGTYDEAVHSDHPDAPSLLIQYLEKEEKPKAGGKPKETAPPDDPNNRP